VDVAAAVGPLVVVVIDVRLENASQVRVAENEEPVELDLTEQEVAERAGTSHSFISKLERGEHIPTIPVLKRILAVLDEELLIGIERRTGGAEPEREIGPVPKLASA
jgi:ribosome-binding protein aMBF1 (putative translation factor)